MLDRTFRPYEPDQLLLLPPSLKDWLPEGHLSSFVSDLVETLDLGRIVKTYGAVTRGNAPYDPRMLVKVLLYAYAVGIPASRQIARELEENVAFRVLAANQRPDFRTLSDFRKQHLAALADLFVQVLKLCQRAGLVKLGHIALDGTKVKANASKHKAMSDGRMVTEEARLTAEVERLLTQAAAADAQGDARYGPDRRGDELPVELARQEQRLATIRAAKTALEQEGRRRPCSIRWFRMPSHPHGLGGADRPSGPAQSHPRRPSATSPIQTAGLCPRRAPRGVFSRATTAKWPSMPRRRSSWPPT